MRRSLLTAISAASAVLKVGYGGATSTNTSGARVYVNLGNVAAAATTLTEARVNFIAAVTGYYIFTCYPDGGYTQVTVRAAAGPFNSAAGGWQSHAVSLAVQSGDMIGVALPNATTSIARTTTGSYSTSSSTTAPAAGVTYPISFNTGVPGLAGYA